MNWIGLPPFGSPARVSDQTISSGVTGEPSCHIAPLRTSIQMPVPASFQPHFSSSPGVNDRSGFWPIY